MKVKVIENHEGEGVFPTFNKGVPVLNIKPCHNCAHWYSCNIEGYSTYIPASYIEKEILNQSYNPTELISKVGDVLIIKQIVNSWLIAENQDGQIGWIPTEKVISI